MTRDIDAGDEEGVINELATRMMELMEQGQDLHTIAADLLKCTHVMYDFKASHKPELQ